MNDKALIESRSIIAGFLKNRRLELGMTQTDLANAIGVSYETISRLERGVFWPRMPQYLKWVSALHCFPLIAEMEQDSNIAETLRKTWVASPSISVSKAEKLLQIVRAKSSEN